MNNAQLRFLALQVRLGRITMSQVPEDKQEAVQAILDAMSA